MNRFFAGLLTWALRQLAFLRSDTTSVSHPTFKKIVLGRDLLLGSLASLHPRRAMLLSFHPADRVHEQDSH